MDYKIGECFAALTGFRAFVEDMLATQRNRLGAEIAALKEELERTKAAATQAAESTASEIKALYAEVSKAYTRGSDTCKEIVDLVVTAEALGPNAEVAALLTQIGDIARYR